MTGTVAKGALPSLKYICDLQKSVFQDFTEIVGLELKALPMTTKFESKFSSQVCLFRATGARKLRILDYLIR